MDEFITADGETLVAFTDESLQQLSLQGVAIYTLFKDSDENIVVHKSRDKIVWESDKESYLSFFSNVYPMGVRGCLGIFYNKASNLNLTNLRQ